MTVSSQSDATRTTTVPPDVEEAVERYREWVQAQDWTFAKTSAETNPHEYIHRSNVDTTMFRAFISFVREYGYQEMYAGDQYTVFDIDGYKYWTMGIPITKTTICNRRSYAGYDVLVRLEEMGEDPAQYVDVTNYRRGELYGAAEYTGED